jgi:hypothetical protein
VALETGGFVQLSGNVTSSCLRLTAKDRSSGSNDWTESEAGILAFF